MRFLFAPPPGDWGGPAIFLKRLANELRRRGYRWTAKPFKYLGVSLLPWQQALVMNAPRNRQKILHSAKPVLAIMGQPIVREYCLTVGLPYLPEYEEAELSMAEVIERSSKVVFISQYVKNVWAEIFERRGLAFPDENSIVSYHGVDINHFRPPEERPRTPFVLGSVGALRGSGYLSNIFQISRLLDFDHRLLIVGSMDAPCRDDFLQAMADPSLKGRTTYVPWVSPESLPQYYGKMHCLCHAVWADACSSVVAEALACGVPVVVPEYGGPAEFVQPAGGVAIKGERWDYGEEFCRSMAAGVATVHDNWQDFALGARRQAEQHVSLEKMVDTYLDFLQLPHWLGA
jgi:glycosyltransferase involved in cell wall biosynthesis